MGGTWLTKDEISSMRDEWSKGDVTKKALAERYGVTLSCVSLRVKGIEQAINPPREEGEEWRDVVGYEGLYLVSNHGRVYKTPKSPKEHRMAYLSHDVAGHPVVSMYKDDIRKSIRVQLLVVYAFTDADPQRKVMVTHVDGDVSNNHVENLEWRYRPKRRSSKPLKGPGERKKKKSLSDEEIREVQTRWLEGESQKDLAIAYDVSTSTIFKQIEGLKRDFKFPDSEIGEGWREIEGYEGRFLISSHGRLYLTGEGRREPRMAIPSVDPNGYLRVNIHEGDGKSWSVPIHRLVAMAFCDGRTEERNVVNHKDGNKQNNHADNLEWCTNEENVHHAINVLGVASGGNDQTYRRTRRTVVRDPSSRPSPFRRFTDEQVVAIRNDPRSACKLAEVYGVNKCTIQNIRSGRTYKNV